MAKLKLAQIAQETLNPFRNLSPAPSTNVTAASSATHVQKSLHDSHHDDPKHHPVPIHTTNKNQNHPELHPSDKLHHSDKDHHELHPSGKDHHELHPSGKDHHELHPSVKDHHELHPSGKGHHSDKTSDKGRHSDKLHPPGKPSDKDHHLEHHHHHHKPKTLCQRIFPKLGVVRPGWKLESTRQWIRDFRLYVADFFIGPYKTFFGNQYFFSTGFYPDMVSRETFERYTARNPIETDRNKHFEHHHHHSKVEEIVSSSIEPSSSLPSSSTESKDRSHSHLMVNLQPPKVKRAESEYSDPNAGGMWSFDTGRKKDKEIIVFTSNMEAATETDASTKKVNTPSKLVEIHVTPATIDTSKDQNGGKANKVHPEPKEATAPRVGEGKSAVISMVNK